MKEIDITNKKFGRWTALKFSHKDKNGKHYWLCKCKCGTIRIVNKQSLLKGLSKSCGCYNISKIIERSTKHSLANSRIYKIWLCIKNRCYNINSLDYIYYGKRNITVCDEWKNDFKTFYDWAIANGYKDNLTIDRINNDGNYEPNNCRWTTMKIQSNNKRNNRLITYNSETHTLSEWAEKTKINFFTLRGRLNRGWSIEKALNTVVQKPTLTDCGFWKQDGTYEEDLQVVDFEKE